MQIQRQPFSLLYQNVFRQIIKDPTPYNNFLVYYITFWEQIQQ